MILEYIKESSAIMTVYRMITINSTGMIGTENLIKAKQKYSKFDKTNSKLQTQQIASMLYQTLFFGKYASRTEDVRDLK